MFFHEPFGGVLPGARGAVLSALMRTGKPLTGRQVHGLVGDRVSLWSVQQALKHFEELGIVSTSQVGRAGVHSINEQHSAVAPLRSLLSPVNLLEGVVRDVVGDTAEAVILFGSVARGEAAADSDIDLAVIAADSWDQRSELQEHVHARLGNTCDVLHLTPADVARKPTHRDPVITDILRDGIALVGALPRPTRKRASGASRAGGSRGADAVAGS